MQSRSYEMNSEAQQWTHYSKTNTEVLVGVWALPTLALPCSLLFVGSCALLMALSKHSFTWDKHAISLLLPIGVFDTHIFEIST